MSFNAKKTALCLGLCLFGAMTAQQAMAVTDVAAVEQAKQTTGRVSDSQGPLIGATVMEKGTTNGTVTDIDGNFSLNVKPGATLVISYVGYVSQEVKAGSGAINVTLKEDGHMVNEIVVIGYGTQRREAVTGSVANIGGEKLNQIAASNAAQALQGRIAGVQMTQTSSKPGEEMQIRIRGQRSLSASNDPLIVLDGIPFMGKLSDINPADIKSMDILKDASATAIYGSRGANGVIMITTAKGAMGTPAKVSYNGYVNIKTLFNRYPMMDGPKYAAMRKYAGTTFQNSLDEDDNTNTDWQDLYYKTGIGYSHDVNVAGGTSGGSYSFGAGYYHDESVVPTEGYDRVSVRGNFDQKVGDWFRFGLTSNTNYHINKGVNNMGGVLSNSPLANPYDENGNLKRMVSLQIDNYFVTTKDVMESLEDVWVNENKGLGTYNTFFGEVKCPWVEGLSYRINVGLNFRSNKSGGFTGTGVNNPDPNSTNSGSVYESQTRNWTVENLLTYDRTFAEKHNLNVVAMYSAEQTVYEQTGGAAQDIPADFMQYYGLDKATGQANLSGYNYWKSGLVSWMTRVMYSYDNKYMLSVALRSDGSSRLAQGHKWHTYPAISAGWNIARENFMEKYKWIDNLKLRVGYGETSNQSINPYATLGTLAIRNYNFGDTQKAGYYVNGLPNPELGWEYSKTWNFGLDFSLFNGRLSGSFEYYIQKTNDILLDVTMPSTSGVSSYTGNIGKTQNKGWEFSLNGVIIDNKNGWNWEAGINLYQNRNKLTELASGADCDDANRWFVGYPIDVIYDYEYEGLWNESDILKDANGNPIVNANGKNNMQILEPAGNLGMIRVKYTGDYDEKGLPTREINSSDRQIQSMEPDLCGGFNSTVTYKNFDFTVIGAFQIGGKLISALHSSFGYVNQLSGRHGQIDVDYWTENNTGAKYPKPGGIQSSDNPKYGSTLGYFNAGYLKIRAITLGYDFASLKAVKDLGISRLRLYATVQNPFVLFSPFNNESGLDPETNSYATQNTAVAIDGYTGKHKMPIVGYNTPATRNFLIGVNLSF